ncbi:MAG: hypothetical protein WBM04_05840 [Candidatus Korobacteraceae bacterium]
MSPTSRMYHSGPADLLVGIRSRFLLLFDDDADASTKQAVQQLAGSLGDIVEARSVKRPGITLVRPDGCIAYSGHNHDGSAVALKSVRSLLQRQTN